MNAEQVVKVIELRCPQCNGPVGAVHRVRNYHHTEPVFTPDGRELRVTDLADGLVVTSRWQQSEALRRSRVPAGPVVEWPVPGLASPLVWCVDDGMFELDPDDVQAWAVDAERSGRRVVTRVVKPAP
ncbi:hypothetical protein [Geodermatophilus sp. URMC 62]|uniref:hypothetical protein n=1 Tax=Geodermatophilus sp. URMC 62 TaxID=3423414 RepID=UPI00406C644F